MPSSQQEARVEDGSVQAQQREASTSAAPPATKHITLQDAVREIDGLRVTDHFNRDTMAFTRGDCVPRPEVLATLARVAAPVDVERLRAALRWALIALAENSTTTHADGTPDHTCDFATNPEKGGCDFHEEYWTAAELVGLLPTEEKP